MNTKSYAKNPGTVSVGQNLLNVNNVVRDVERKEGKKLIEKTRESIGLRVIQFLKNPCHKSLYCNRQVK